MKKSITKAIGAVMALSMCAAGTGLLPAVAEETSKKTADALPLGTYEVETFEGAEVWTSIYENQIPGYSGEGFAYLTATPISFNVEVEEEGMYEIKFRAAQILSEEGRKQTLSVNGIDYSYDMPYVKEWTDISFGVFRLKEGVNELTLKPIYGYGAYDTVTIEKAVLPEVKGTSETCDPEATPEAKALLKYLNSVYGKNILSGQQEIYGGGHGVQTSIRYDAASDTCVDGDGKSYTIDKDSYDEDEQGNKFPWHCMDETGFVYTYSTQNHNYTYNDYEQECRYLYELTGHYPAIRGFDFNTHSPGFAWEDGVTDRMIDWAKNRNGICTASWHVTVPKDMSDFEVDKDGNITKISNDWQAYTYGITTDFVTANCMVEGTKEYYFFKEAMRLLAAELQKLQDAGVPVLFRPLHEAEGNADPAGTGAGSWFWWSKEGTEVYHQLWKLLYTTLTEEYGLHNIIWEQNLYAWSDASANWYTGDEWVDIVGFDKYNTQYNRHDGNTTGPNEDSESKIFWSQVGYVDNKKMVSMPENDSIPSLENLQIEQAKWLYFCTWYDGEAGAPQFISGAEYQNPETLKTLFDSDYCITLEELPENLYQSSGEDTKPTEKPTEKETSEKTEKILYGDVDQNGEVDILDIITLNKNLLGKEEINETQQKAADVNLSGKPDIGDSTLILKFIVGLVKTLPDES